MAWYERVIAAIGGLLLVYPGLVTDLVGLGLVGIVAVLQIIGKNQNKLQNA